MTSELLTFGQLGDGPYVLVTTFRKDGTPVPTPVWALRDGEAVAIWTPTNSGKVKRIRRNPAVTVAPCTFDGRATGPAHSAQAVLLDDAGSDRVRQMIKSKFPITGRLSVYGSRLRRGRRGTIGIRITPSADEPLDR